MRLALVQTKQNALYDFADPNRSFTAEWSAKLVHEMTEQTFSLIEGISVPCDLIVTTEAVNFPGNEDRLPGKLAEFVDALPLEKRFSALAAQKHSWLIADLYVNRDGATWNEAVVFNREGRVSCRYDKVHLAGDEQRTLHAGDKYQIISTDFGKVGVCICWDMQFPEVCRTYALRDVPLVVCPTWGWESIYSHARAYENGIWVAGAMAVPYRGPIEGIRTPSEVVAPDGSAAACASADKPEVLMADIDLSAMQELHSLRMHDRRPSTYGLLTVE